MFLWKKKGVTCKNPAISIDTELCFIGFTSAYQKNPPPPKKRMELCFPCMRINGELIRALLYEKVGEDYISLPLAVTIRRLSVLPLLTVPCKLVGRKILLFSGSCSTEILNVQVAGTAKEARQSCKIVTFTAFAQIH